MRVLVFISLLGSLASLVASLHGRRSPPGDDREVLEAITAIQLRQDRLTGELASLRVGRAGGPLGAAVSAPPLAAAEPVVTTAPVRSVPAAETFAELVRRAEAQAQDPARETQLTSGLQQQLRASSWGDRTTVQSVRCGSDRCLIRLSVADPEHLLRLPELAALSGSELSVAADDQTGSGPVSASLLLTN